MPRAPRGRVLDPGRAARRRPPQDVAYGTSRTPERPCVGVGASSSTCIRSPRHGRRCGLRTTSALPDTGSESPMKRLRAALLAAVVGATAIIAPIAIAPAPRRTAGSPLPSRQDNCAKGTTSFDCGSIKYEPQSVEAPKGSMKCSGGSGYAILDDASKPWPRTTTGRDVTFQWNLTANHATSVWEYFVDGQLFATFDGGGVQPPRTSRTPSRACRSATTRSSRAGTCRTRSTRSTTASI